MQTISSRLQYFFKPRSWVLLLQEETSKAQHLEPLELACKHWGGQLAFPPNWGALASQENWNSNEFWKRAFPGLQLLHQRKQHILLSSLLQGFDVLKASQLLSRKLHLSQNAFGFLLYFDENRKTFAKEIYSHETPRDWASYVRESFLQKAFEIPIEIGQELDADTLDWLKHREETAGLPLGIAQLIRDGLAQRSDLLASSHDRDLLASAQEELPHLHLDLYALTFNLPELDIKLRMKPLDFSLYYLYLKHPEGFTNKNRFAFQEELKGYYRRFKSSENRDRLDKIAEGLFDPREDKPFRDTVYRINTAIKKLFDDTEYTRPFCISGEAGEIRKITYASERWTQNPEP